MSAAERIEVQLGYATSSVMVEREALEMLAEHFTGRRLPIARSIYLAFVELALAGRIETTRAVIADYAGVTRKALDDYVPEMEEARLIERERRSDGAGRSLPNIWTVHGKRGATAGSPGGPSAGEGHAEHPLRPSSSTSSKSERKDEGAGLRGSPSVSFHEAVPDEMAVDAHGLLAQKRRVDGRVVTGDEMVKAAAGLAEFNRQSGSEYGLGAHLTAIVMRIRERPALDADGQVRLVQSAWRLKWWERQPRRRSGRVTPAVVWGNPRVFDAVWQDAAEEAKGRKPDIGQTDRYERSGPAEREG